MVSFKVTLFRFVEATSIEILSQNCDELWVEVEGRLFIVMRSPGAAVKT